MGNCLSPNLDKDMLNSIEYLSEKLDIIDKLKNKDKNEVIKHSLKLFLESMKPPTLERQNAIYIEDEKKE